jgi:hypothetical protein
MSFFGVIPQTAKAHAETAGLEGRVKLSWIDLTGYLASLSVLATFCMGTMGSLRTVAILSNVLFITYGLELHLYPVLLLHATLLPINALKMVQLRRNRPQISGWLTAVLSRKSSNTRRIAG